MNQKLLECQNLNEFYRDEITLISRYFILINDFSLLWLVVTYYAIGIIIIMCILNLNVCCVYRV